MYLSDFEIGGKHGFKDGYKIVIPAQFESTSSFHDGLALVMLNRKFGVINTTGDFVIPNEYDDLRHLFGELYAARINSGKDDWKCGVIDANNKIIIPFEYKCIHSKDDKYFLCYKTAISNTENVRYLSLNSRYSYTKQSECNWFNLTGAFLTALDVVNNNEDYLIIKNQSDKFGAIHSDGNTSIEPIYDTLEYCTDNVFLATQERDNLITSCIVGNNDNVIFSTLSDIFFKDGFFLVSSAEHEDQWISVDGKVTYVGHATPLSSNYLKVYKNKKCGVLDKNGDKVINFIYDGIVFCKTFFVVRREDCIGLVGLKGEVILDAVYKKLECVSIENNPLFLGSEKTLGKKRWDNTVYKGYCKEYCFDTAGHTNYNGNPCDYLCRSVITLNQRYNNRFNETEYIISASDSFDLTKPIILYTEEYCELFTTADGIIQNSRFDEIQQITQVCYVVKKNDKYGVFRIDESTITIPVEHDQIQFFGGHTVLLRKDNMWGAKSLVLKKHLFYILAKVDIPFENFEIKILDNSQFHFGVKRKYINNYNGEEKPYFTIINSNGKGNEALQELYLEDNFERFDDNHYLTKRNGKYGFVSSFGYISIPFIYDEIENRKTGSFNVRIGNAWGVIDLSGKELVRVKYAQPIPLYIAAPENSYFDYDFLKNDIAKVVKRYKDRIIVSDALSGFLGCLDMKGNEVIPTIYQHLQFDDKNHEYDKELPGDFLFFGFGGTTDSEYCTFFSDVIYGTWGCLSYDGKIIINPKYSCLRVTDNFIIAGRDGCFIGDSDSYNSDEYDGVFDLYTFDGELLIGGFREVLYDSVNKVYAFFFGGEWERYCSYEDEWNGIRDYSYRFKRNNDLWLLLDSELKAIIRNPDNSQHHFSKGFIGNIEIKNEDSKVKHIYNMPLFLMSKGFKCFGLNCAIVKDSNSDEAKVAALDFKTGNQTPFHESIEQITDDLFFFSDERKSGIRTISDIVIPADYLFFTKPDNGYFFGAKELGDGFSSLTLFHVSDLSKPIATAIESTKTSSLISDLGYGRLKLDFFGGRDLSNARIPKKNIFAADFLKLVDDTETNYFTDKWKNPYYFGSDYRIGAEDYYEPDYSDDDRDYMRDSWDAMTDGMYGDMPDGFDGDFDFLGR